ncbi:hypothetical protein ACOSQ2_002705 [Xanthoceras sorbifolium]
MVQKGNQKGMGSDDDLLAKEAHASTKGNVVMIAKAGCDTDGMKSSKNPQMQGASSVVLSGTDLVIFYGIKASEE